MKTVIPTIKGVFVNSHITKVRKEIGEEGVRLLEKKFGKPLRFSYTENVPIREEVLLIEYSLEILSKKKFSKTELSFEAGRLHFRNFLTTPLARITVPYFRKNFKTILLQARHLAGHVFQGVDFQSKELGDTTVKVVMKNNDYPIEHLQGLFYEWMKYSGLEGEVHAKKVDSSYEYVIIW